MTFARLGLLLVMLLTGTAPLSAAAPDQNAVKALKLLDIAEHAHDGGAALAVVLSEPLDPKGDHKRYLNVSRKDGKPVDGGWILAKNGRTLYFPDIEPRVDYKVTVYQGLTAVNGARLLDTVSRAIKTRNIAASITFGGNGSLLPAKLDRGLPVISINIDQADIDFHRVDNTKLDEFFRLASYDGLKNFWNLGRLKQMAKPVYSGRYELNPPANKRREFRIPLGPIKALKEPGVYVAVIRAAAQYDNDLTDAVYFTVTDIGLHARFYQDRIDVNLRSISNGSPLGSVDVRLLDKSGKQLDQARSTPDGLVSFSGFSADKAAKPRYIAASKGDYFTVLDISRPALDLSDFNIGQRPFRPTELFLYSPRDLYRPGEKVVISGLLRNHDGRRTHEPPLKARFRRPDGENSREFTWRPGKGGYYETRYKLPAGAMTGTWQFEVDLPGSKPAVYSLKVEEFMPERMKLQLHPEGESPLFKADQAVTIPIHGEYLYGAPAAGNRLEGYAEIRHYREPLKQWKGYQFGDIKEKAFLQDFSLKDITLDKEGKASLNIDSRWQKTRSPLNVYVTTSLFESGGRPISRSAANLVWPGDALIGIRPAFGNKNPKADSRASFEVILAKADGSLVGGKQLDAQLISEDRQYFWEWSSNEGWHYAYSEREYAVDGLTLTSSEKGPVKFKLPVEYGHYRLEVTDSQSGYKSSIRFHAGRDWYYWWKRSQVDKYQAARPDAVTLSFDRQEYQPGDTATLTIVPPADGEAVILLESDKPLWSQRLKVEKKGSKIRIPVDEAWDRHDIYASAVVFRPADKGKGITPHRAFGLTHLKMSRAGRRLKVNIDAPDKTRPNQQVPVTVRLDNTKPGSRHFVTLAAVDVGVLNITRFATPDPHQGFFAPRRYGVDSRDIYDRIIDPGKGALAKLRYGGDGEEPAEDQLHGTPPKSDVKIVSLFSGAVTVNEKGEARIPLDLPDFNGRLRLMALGFSDDEYGHADQEMTLAAPLVTQIAMPRFLARGDETTLALDIHNLSGREQKIKVSLQAEGPVTIAARTEEISLAKGEKTTHRVTARAEGVTGQATIRLDIGGAVDKEGRGIQLLRQWKLGVRPPWPAVMRRQDQALKSGERFVLDQDLLQDLIPEATRVQLSIGTAPNLDLHDQLDNLLQYPYGCLEQTSSRTYPLVFADQANLKALKLKSPFSPKERIEQLEKGFERIFSMQKYNGSFGLWSRNDSEEHWLTAYVGDLMLDALNAGIEVSKPRTEKVLKRLGYYLRQPGILTEQRYSSHPKHYAFAVKSYAGYVLSKIRQAPLAALRLLYEKEAKESKTAMPLIHLGIALHNMGDLRLAKEAIDKGLAINREQGYYGDYGSDLRDSARMLHLLAHYRLSGQARQLGLTLAEQLRGRRYLSTQERNAVFLAGVTLARADQEPWQAELMQAVEKIDLNNNGRLYRRYSGKEADAGLELLSRHDNDLYVTALIRGYAEQAPKPSSDALSIARRYYDMKGKPVIPSLVAEGTVLVTRLDVSAKERHPDLLLVDLLPAGFELENPNLPDSVQLDNLKIEEKTIKEWSKNRGAKHQEYRDDRYVAALDIAGSSNAHLFYVVRAVTPGSYRMPPPMVEDMYAPEIHAIGWQPTATINVTAKGNP